MNDGKIKKVTRILLAIDAIIYLIGAIALIGVGIYSIFLQNPITIAVLCFIFGFGLSIFMVVMIKMHGRWLFKGIRNGQ